MAHELKTAAAKRAGSSLVAAREGRGTGLWNIAILQHLYTKNNKFIKSTDT